MRETADHDPGADLNIRLLHALVTCIHEQKGSEAIGPIAAAAGLSPADLDGHTRWVSFEQFEAVLAASRRLFPSDEAFRDACAYHYQKPSASYGALLLLMRAATAWDAYVFGCKHLSLFARIGTFEPERLRGRCRIIYRSSRAESHLMCLSRLGQIRVLPTLWGLPPVIIDHPRCIARGDDCCEYAFHLIEPVRWLPSAIGFALGWGALGGLRLVVGTTLFSSFWPFLLPIVFLMAGACFEWRRTSLANMVLAQEMREGLTEVATADAEARREILAFQQRQRAWTQMLEEQVAERVAAQQKVVEEIRALESRRVQALRAFSHDLRNPLTIVSCSTESLRRGSGQYDGELAEDLAHASQQMTALIENLVRTLSAEESLLKLTPRELQVAPLVDRLRRRLNALCYQRDIRTSVFSTREAPESILIDELLLDRVIDNLLTNATKYTERGSILVEVGGTPGFLTIKVSDTGRGIEQEAIERVFKPGGSDPQVRARNSFGLGLSVVVQLLAQVGGKLEVMSKAGVGTTFWAHFPVQPAPAAETQPQEDLVSKVVVIRRAQGGVKENR